MFLNQIVSAAWREEAEDYCTCTHSSGQVYLVQPVKVRIKPELPMKNQISSVKQNMWTQFCKPWNVSQEKYTEHLHVVLMMQIMFHNSSLKTVDTVCSINFPNKKWQTTEMYHVPHILPLNFEGILNSKYIHELHVVSDSQYMLRPNMLHPNKYPGNSILLFKAEIMTPCWHFLL